MNNNRTIFPVEKPTPCFNQNGVQIGWYNPRFLCTALFVFAWSKTEKEWCVLGSIRGEGAESFKGYMNCPCGYMDINITTKENAVKEAFEECGVRIQPNEIELFDIEDDPSVYQQHVTLHYGCVLDKVDADTITFSHEGNEIDADGNLEVGAISFIPLSKVDDFTWAFGHDIILKQYAKKKYLTWGTTWKKIKNYITFKF